MRDGEQENKRKWQAIWEGVGNWTKKKEIPGGVSFFFLIRQIRSVRCGDRYCERV